MIKFFRRFFESKLGVPITLAFLGLIAIAFASADITGSTFGGVSGGDRVAVVGDSKISTSDLRTAATNALDQLRQDDPTLSMNAFVERGGLDDVLDRLIDRTAIAEFAKRHGLRAGDNLVNSEILDVPIFRGPDGNFSQDIYRQWLRQNNLTDAQFRDDLAQQLLAQQLVQPIGYGAKAPEKLSRRFAALEKERRKGAIGLVPSSLFAPEGDPGTDQLSSYYQDNRTDYIRPERRVIRYATFDASVLGDEAEPTDNEIAARYEENREQYAASETRRLSQLIVPTRQAAETIRQRVGGGGSLAEAAREAGLSVATIGPVSREDYAAQTSAAVAQAVFGAERGAIAAPARSGLGWHVVRVEDVSRVAARTLAQARDEIAEEVRAEKLRRAIADLSASVEEQLDKGVALSAVAESLGVELETTPPITADGVFYGSAGRAPQVLGPALQTAFQMEEGEPQIAELVPGELFLIFEANEITESATAPLSEIRERVTADWRRAQGQLEARKAADRILARLAKGEGLRAAMRAENSELTGFDEIDYSREQLGQAQGRVPPPLALMFSMAEGSSKRLEAPRDAGWFIVTLDDIVPGTIEEDDPIFAEARRQLSAITGGEYSQQFLAAIRKAVGAERNPAAIEAVRKQLVGEN